MFVKDEYKNEVLQMAWDISGGNKDFLLMISAENGALTPNRKHNASANAVGVDWGFCGINDHFHKEARTGKYDLRDKPREQMQWCWDKYKNTCLARGKEKRCTYFYGHNSRLKNKLGIEFPNPTNQ